MFLLFGRVLFPPSTEAALVSATNRRFDIRIESSSARVAGPSIFMMDEKLNESRISRMQFTLVLNDDTEEEEDATSK